MNRIISFNLTKKELGLWLSSCLLIVVSYSFLPEKEVFTVITSLVGATALIYVSKGEPLGQIITVIFSLLYAVISYEFRYYGEMITYLGMTAPIAILATLSWCKNPYQRGQSQVKVASLSKANCVWLLALTVVVTFVFYFILEYFNTANLVWSTVSIATSFVAASLTFLRSPLYALAYAANDIVLIMLWILATLEDSSFFPMIICFFVFLVNDMYGFFNWKRIERKQKEQ